MEQSEDIEQVVENEKVEPLEVKVVNKEEKKVSQYDSKDDEEYDELGITKEEIKDFEDNK